MRKEQNSGAIARTPAKKPNGKHGAVVPRALIEQAIRNADGLDCHALRIIREHGFPEYRKSAFQERVAHDAGLSEIREEARMRICAEAVSKLREAVTRGEEWAIKQVLNSPIAAHLGLGRPAAQVAVAADNVSVAVFDSEDLAARLSRLDAALAAM